MSDHVTATNSVAGLLHQSPETVDAIVSAYLREISRMGWAAVRGNARLIVTESGVQEEDMRTTPHPTDFVLRRATRAEGRAALAKMKS